MIQKNKNQRITLIKPVLLAPLFIAMLTLSPAVINNSNASTTQYKKLPENKVYEDVDHEPEYQGGIKAFYSYLAKTINYPAEARKNKIQGKVFVQFVVEKDGSITDVKAVRGPGHGLNEEAIKAVKLSPKWKPGTQKGKIVRVKFTVPINFTLA